MRTALEKKKAQGVLIPEKHGGRQEYLKPMDDILRTSVKEHIDKFPKVETHYCRQSSTREYLHPELTLKKVYDLYCKEIPHDQPKASFKTYTRVFGSINLSFHHPKKKCSLCSSYRYADEERKI
ncbi:hypothetical protein PR048_015696 [Dryococelus australis]|uniref:Uncharacterized protein n=1 Tax=Dryococelus australis TaxID=614101 RepID=A0ABQ9HHN2_9NEOP|nr:hypothetical protein PR048_015696 [Dryococelus australis]